MTFAPAQPPKPASLVQRAFASERLLLRPLVEGDAALLTRHAADRRVAMGTRSIPHPLPEGSAEAFIQAAHAPDKVEDIWAIDGTPSGSDSLLGVISLKALDRKQSQIGYWVAPGHWHSGIASEAVRLLLAENPHDNQTVFAEVFQDNPVSARLLTQAGFEYIGDAEAFAVSRDIIVPTWTYLRHMR
ncbi:GNAT family N-acetyltransferase [Pararhodobacter oceanensis]|uniref:GNAT family N-acetyltransferase n=1 Tax=Pararhodobacter oceanensis TaxID=2172121 RepID=A0A2T8HTV0_9RHOB|nr:GNAT family N-acetyltransferase [Pararhodobacter oceanensis]PVH28772.1 GNAT family N-acetyltransferase [Pararhodobacter oceanensis]